MNQKHIKGWRVGLDAELAVRVSEDNGLPTNA